MVKKRLDYLAIPRSGNKLDKERKKRAVKEIHNRFVDKVLMMVGKDSEEDILYLGKIAKRGDRIGIDTFPLHFREYLELIKKAQRDGKFPKRVKIEHVYTGQPFKLKIYGILGLMEEKIKRRRLDYKKKRHEKSLEKIKGFVKRVLR